MDSQTFMVPLMIHLIHFGDQFINSIFSNIIKLQCERAYFSLQPNICKTKDNEISLSFVANVACSDAKQIFKGDIIPKHQHISIQLKAPRIIVKLNYLTFVLKRKSNQDKIHI